ncbi:hypothetical protein SNK03_012318 [Fusarium graminearum]|uniref:Chromosome 3, complete genome n=2 Tax=Gibberella zeae TaxID=5518 RepID=I1RQA7_GIBZE|nr:hypothetical protein FGSG_06248 [Fusarium graminearum PH-1]KAI6751503.1 hypothetical protein HG531_006199 [Fusarium graminearum]ESU12320.1 hypothetical protein FGSG_06248 [Fusarium graminearum PH-1]PCD19160.1 hypothetical protein FGRA07_05965 [Fusarium graminearum]CAF3491814.1 unnamed protein product [Fusarium graminearum]CAF3554412.1 unnamed protein product [Fusarium graminearum]|eukprot:XP_011324896.1 hypothetical protein FGSG_06248 [Fusarium graminearum PH-1]
MSKAEPADQVKFLVSCIGHTSNGRPDFQAVADELSIVSKAAAQKRYERMLKAHGISRPGALVAANNGDGNGDSPPATPTTPGKRKAKGETTGSAKKPRTPRAKAKKESDDEEEPKPKSKASATKRKVKKEEVVEKKEEEQDEASAESPKSLSDVPASDES